jgi:hypothetical protein
MLFPECHFVNQSHLCLAERHPLSIGDASRGKQKAKIYEGPIYKGFWGINNLVSFKIPRHLWPFLPSRYEFRQCKSSGIDADSYHETH